MLETGKIHNSFKQIHDFEPHKSCGSKRVTYRVSREERYLRTISATLNTMA